MRTLPIAGAAAALLGACASPLPLPDGVPETLKPAAHESLALIAPAKGVQVYACRAGQADTYGWAFVAPEADLFDRAGRRIGHHDAGPRWHLADGSRVVGALKQRADAPVAGAIPWLLLTTRAEGQTGTLSAITSIQRLNTQGGVAPAAGCSRETAGATARVAYTADYYFYRSQP